MRDFFLDITQLRSHVTNRKITSSNFFVKKGKEMSERNVYFKFNWGHLAAEVFAIF